ncbi:MAG: hypothetical protein U5L96_06760 [Owenweeksia sp.]|nr:hypothetical protein [Owenweeksia sp.]
MLLVEDMSPAEEADFHDNLKKMREPGDQFIYKVTVQPSFQDALIAILCNQNIQAVVVRYAPRFASKNITPLLRPYIQSVLDHNLEAVAETDLGPVLGQNRGNSGPSSTRIM